MLFRTRDEAIAQDLTSETFMRLLNALRAGKAPANLHAWLFGVANHLATDHFRRQARRPQVELVEEIAADDEAADPEIVSSANQATAAVRAALQELTEEQQRVLALRFGEGRSVNDTAELIGKSVTAVKLQFRAVAALRRKLERHQRMSDNELYGPWTIAWRAWPRANRRSAARRATRRWPPSCARC
jgi:RNA polymerase sigma-70 factor (ECF subfamily)